ncbi:MAG: hypothetical protein KGY45_03000 [Hadesarchaea archaeon]|nr:hypothetical protein [Hadesarchaea archaeon]
MLKIFYFLLPIIDVFKLDRILNYYSSLGVKIPYNHARNGLIERWIGYLPASFILSWVIDLQTTLIIITITFLIVGPIELYLMYLGIGPWKFFKEKSISVVSRIFLLETYNVVLYLILGVILGFLIPNYFL